MVANYMGKDRLRAILKNAAMVLDLVKIRPCVDVYDGYGYYRGNEWMCMTGYRRGPDKNATGPLLKIRCFVSGDNQGSRVELSYPDFGFVPVITYYTPEFEPIRMDPATPCYDERYLVDGLKKNEEGKDENMNENATIDNNANIEEERLKRLKAYYGYAEEGNIVPEEELMDEDGGEMNE